MEPTEVIIARLVLGYLKRESCKKAYEDFLRTSVSLGEHNSNRSKYIPTRFIGLTLEDILTEYFEISRIVQGRLEPTEYFDEGHSKTSLVKQLLYLLNKAHSSRASTPCPRSPLDSNLDETSPSYIDHISDVEATPAHTLPGNTQYESGESYTHKNSRRKTQSKYVKVGTVTSSPLMEKEDVSEILTQTLLENREFHEKIAETINRVAEKQFKSAGELDETIKTVMKKTEEDPIFDRILEDIIGSSNHLDDDNKAFETGSTTSSNAHKTDHRNHKTVVVEENAHRTSESRSVDEQNNDAVQSIVASSQRTSSAQLVEVGISNDQQIVERRKNEVVVFDGSLDKYLQSDTAGLNIVQTHPVPNPLYINTTATLFIPTNVPGYSNNEARQPLVVQPAVSWPAPGILTENDIMTMPTVILSDAGSNISDKAPVSRIESVSNKRPKSILPTTAKPRIELAANLSEYLKLNDTGDVKSNTGLKKVHYPKSTPNVISSASTVLTNAKEIVPETVTLANSNDQKPPEEKMETKREQTSGASMPTTCTPPPLQQTKKGTPKSGSHVRNLDFSSPPKITSTHKKSARSKLGSKSPQFVHKKKAAKLLLFKDSGLWDADLRAICPQPASSSPKKKRLSTCVAKKRIIENDNLNQKRKRVSCGDKKTKKRVKIAKVLNTTEDDAALLEAALQTPVKKEEPEKEVEEDTKKTTVSTVNEPKKKNSDISTILDEKPNENKPTNGNIETPETAKEICANPVKANRNIMSLLETPLKDHRIPKTPGLSTPSDMNLSTLNFTPFTKMLEDNLQGIDIGSLPTPSMPITPNFPQFTPTVDLVSPFSNRPTDYSTSSSYYQPSDNEQNKSLEAQLREAEKRSPVVDKVKSIFNKNVIGKKNLNLMRRNAAESPDSSSSSTSKSDSDTLWGAKESNDTVILKKKESETPRRMYSLRNRSISQETSKNDPKIDCRKDAMIKRNSDSKKVNKKPNKCDQDEETVISKELDEKTIKIIQKNKKTITGSTKDGKTTLKRAGRKPGLKTSNKKKIVFDSHEIEQEMESESKDEQENVKKTGSKTKRSPTAKLAKTKRLSVEETVSKSGDYKDQEKLKKVPDTAVADVANKDVEEEKSKSISTSEVVVIKDLQGSRNKVKKTVEDKKKSFTTSEKVETTVTEDLGEITRMVQKTVKVSAISETQERKESAITTTEVYKDSSESTRVQKTVEVCSSFEKEEIKKPSTPSGKVNSVINRNLGKSKMSASSEERDSSTTSKEVNKDSSKSTKIQETVEVSVSFETGEKKKPSLTREKIASSNNRNLAKSTKVPASSEIQGRKKSSITSEKVSKDSSKSAKVQKTVEVSASCGTSEKNKLSTTSQEVKDVIQRDFLKSTKVSADVGTREKKESCASVEVEDVNRALMTMDQSKTDEEIKSVHHKAKSDHKSLVFKELEEKRKRTINKLKEPEPKKQVNGKFKIKPIPNLVGMRKKPRKSDSPKKVRFKNTRHLFSSEEDSDDLADDIPAKPNKDESKGKNSKTENISDKSESDVEARNLIEGLKERGIHLMHNKSPKKKIDESIKEESTTEVNSTHCSSFDIETIMRDIFDTKNFESEDVHIIFDDEQVTQNLNNYRIDEHAPSKMIIGKVYVEGLGEEIDVPLKLSPFESLLDIPSEENLNNAQGESNRNLSEKIIIRDIVVIKGKNIYERVLNDDNKKENTNRGCIEMEKSITNTNISENVEGKFERGTENNASEEMSIDDDLMNFASTGKEKDFRERSQSPIIGGRKRKLSDGNNRTEKKAKSLLKIINVDSFLNDIHAGTSNYLKK